MGWPNPFVMAKLIYNQLTPTKNLALCFATAHSKHIKFPHSLSAGKHRRVLWELMMFASAFSSPAMVVSQVICATFSLHFSFQVQV